MAESTTKDANQMDADCNQESLSGSSTLCEGTRFAFVQKPKETDVFHDIRSFVKKFEKEFERDSPEITGSSYNPDEYALSLSSESLLFDKVTFKNRIMSGGLLLCHFRIS